MATIVDEIATLLASSLSLTLGTGLAKNFLPSSPNAVLAVLETGGGPPSYVLGTRAPDYENPTVQVLARGEPTDFDTPRAQAQAAWDAINAVQAEALSGTDYGMVTMLNSPFPLRKDELERYEIAFNLTAERKPA